jgi:hypothetical protein
MKLGAQVTTATNNVDYTKGYDIADIRRQLGSKGVPLNPMNNAPFKRPFVHRKVAQTIDISDAHPDWDRLLSFVESM